MPKIEDKFFLGFLTGVIAKTAMFIVDLIAFLLKLDDQFFWYIAASPFVALNEIKSPNGIIIGLISDYAVAISLGILVVYLLYYTGTDYFYLKGLTVGLIFWLVYGFLLNINVIRIRPTSITASSINLLLHILIGIVSAKVAVIYGKNIYPKS